MYGSKMKPAGTYFGTWGVWLLLLVAAFPAFAGDRATLTFDPATSSSKCIGNPLTPLCAVETYEACYYWVDKKVCAVTGVDPDTFQFVPGGYSKLSIYHYWVENQKVITAEDIPIVTKVLSETDNPYQKKFKVLSGDIVLQLRWVHCQPVDACVIKTMNDSALSYGEGCPPTRCGTEDYPRTYLVHRFGDKWRVHDWYANKSFQGDFWKRK